MKASGGYPYSSMTAALRDRVSPLRHYLDNRYPNTRPPQADHRQTADHLIVDGHADAGTLGAAFDYTVQLILDPMHIPRVALLGFAQLPAPEHVVVGVILAARQVPGSRTKPAPESLLRACWALALFAEVYRAGQMPGSPIIALVQARSMSTPLMLALATDDALQSAHPAGRVALIL